MKTKFAQMIPYISKIDRRHIQIAYLVFMLAISVVMRSPSDGGSGSI